MAHVISGHTCAVAGVSRSALLHHCWGRYPNSPSLSSCGAKILRLW